MAHVRIALANMAVPSSPHESIDLVTDAITAAADVGAEIVCFPECIVPGYRIGAFVSPPDTDFLNHAWSVIDETAARFGIAVILGTERVVDGSLRITARITYSDGSLAGYQDKVQLDPSEEETYGAGSDRRVFRCGPMTFGVVICHEGWRYPETVRWAVRRGAQVVFHPHFEIIEKNRPCPAGFADPDNSFHEKAALCRAAENTCYFATVNCALEGATTTSAIIAPDGTVLAHQPYGEAGLLVRDIDLSKATGLLAKRLKPESTPSPPEAGTAR